MIWTASFHDLQEFVEDVLSLSAGKWSSPGGDTKLYCDKSQNISIRWHANSQTITVCEAEKGNIEEKLNSLSSISKKLANSVAIEDTKIPDEDDHIEIGNENDPICIDNKEDSDLEKSRELY